jgi:hypothetical protein
MRIKAASLGRPYVPSLLFYTPWSVQLKHNQIKRKKHLLKCQTCECLRCNGKQRMIHSQPQVKILIVTRYNAHKNLLYHSYSKNQEFQQFIITIENTCTETSFRLTAVIL